MRASCFSPRGCASSSSSSSALRSSAFSHLIVAFMPETPAAASAASFLFSSGSSWSKARSLAERRAGSPVARFDKPVQRVLARCWMPSS